MENKIDFFGNFLAFREKIFFMEEVFPILITEIIFFGIFKSKKNKCFKKMKKAKENNILRYL